MHHFYVSIQLLIVLRLALLFTILVSNGLLLQRVFSQRMNEASRTHRNEKRLVKTILIVNTCLSICIIPQSVLGGLKVLLDIGILEYDYETYSIILNGFSFLRPAVFMNGALNASIYLCRIRHLRNFYTRTTIKKSQHDSKRASLDLPQLHSTETLETEC